MPDGSLAEACPTLTNMLVIIVGGIPIAMPTVLSVTLALGAFKLAKEGAIVARMSAVEELAGLDILCSDKTGRQGVICMGGWVRVRAWCVYGGGEMPSWRACL
jgi:hypothetical protein